MFFKEIALIACFAALIACEELDDGYQFGDISRMTARQVKEIEQAREDYCETTEGSTLKKTALLVIRGYLPEYPEDGICTGWNQY